MANLNAQIALHKFGLGARTGEAELVGTQAQNWLQTQLTDLSSDLDSYDLPTSKEGIELFFAFLEAERAERQEDRATISAASSPKVRLISFFSEIDRIKRQQMLIEDDGVRGPSLAKAQNIYLDAKQSNASKPAEAKSSRELLEDIVGILYEDIGVRTTHAVLTPASFREALVRFWSDHFNVFANKSLLLTSCTGAMEREAIRPHITGKFSDMLIAVESHPAMLAYLDNWFSVGPDSWAGKQFGLGINENLAREILELHTLGVGGGYGQDDIIAFANAITGWSIGNPDIQPENLGEFIFESLIHQPGPQTFMGKVYLGTGQDQGIKILEFVANHANTARFIASKLARHFHSDTPPDSLIERLEKAFIDSDGDLLVVSSALVIAPEMWDGSFVKLRNSEEFAIAALRAFGFDELTPQQSVFVFNAVAQIPFSHHSPDGWPKTEASWASSSILSARINLAELLSGFVGGQPPPVNFAENILGETLSDHSANSIKGAGPDKVQGYTLFLMSPEFQRR
ncbi:MAG: hypothetical protein COA47_15445 [Robiginitomaculum sp.]|nr:MAG: hypothetical protein COA47_15445 [Robiginitomaculum sp.]